MDLTVSQLAKARHYESILVPIQQPVVTLQVYIYRSMGCKMLFVSATRIVNTKNVTKSHTVLSCCTPVDVVTQIHHSTPSPIVFSCCKFQRLARETMKKLLAFHLELTDTAVSRDRHDSPITKGVDFFRKFNTTECV